jgi:hypothetical protein
MNMFRALSVALLLLISPLSHAAGDEDILQDYARHYQELPAEVNLRGADVVELFSYSCNVCNSARPNVTEMLKHLPAGTKFQAYAISSRRPEWQVSARAFRAFEVAGLTSQLHDRFFDYIQTENAPMKDDADIEAFFRRSGHPELVGSWNSPDATALAQVIDDLWKASQSRGVPVFLVGGRYKVTYGSDQTPEKFSRLVNALLDKCGCEAPR